MSQRVDRGIRVALVAVFVSVVVLYGWVCDDAFITFRVVRQVWSGEGLVWNPGWRVQVFTHPLWMLQLVAIQPLTGGPWFSALILSALCAAASGWMWIGAWARRVDTAVLAFALLVSSKALVEFSTSGLETPLTVALLLGLVLARDRGAVGVAAWLGGLAVLNRLDAVVWVLPLCLWGARSRTERLSVGWRVAVLPGVWMALSCVLYGSPWPNPALAKAALDLPIWARLSNGLALVVNSVAWDPVLLPTALGAALAGWWHRRDDRLLAPVVVASVASAAYVVVVGGDFMSGRFLVVPALLALLAGLRVWDATAPTRRVTLGWSAALLIVGIANPHGPVQTGLDPKVGVMDARGIADERTFAASTAGVVAWLRGETSFQTSGTGPPLSGVVQRVSGAGGAGYGAPVGLIVVDDLAITDPFLARLPVRFEGGRVGHFARPIPEGYLESLGDGKNHLRDPASARCFDRIRDAATRPVGSQTQLGAAMRLSLRGCSDLWGGRRMDPSGAWHEASD